MGIKINLRADREKNYGTLFKTFDGGSNECKAVWYFCQLQHRLKIHIL